VKEGAGQKHQKPEEKDQKPEKLPFTLDS
jgi:hypothetical protein